MGQREKVKAARDQLLSTIKREVNHLRSLYGPEASTDFAVRLNYDVDQVLSQFIPGEELPTEADMDMELPEEDPTTPEPEENETSKRPKKETGHVNPTTNTF